MPIHLQDFMGQHPWLLWLTIAPLFVAAEVLRPNRAWVMWAPACVVGGAVAAFAPSLWWLQLLFVGVAGSLALLWLRPRLTTPT
ncbi:NfeD family protein [Propionibacteriaceae bacterium Y2011]|uniref:NfeD family protein n=1 Tax=Microlunatus sp. Y2014 TaxID=3418488 RepID=UPI003B477858